MLQTEWLFDQRRSLKNELLSNTSLYASLVEHRSPGNMDSFRRFGPAVLKWTGSIDYCIDAAK